MTFDLVARGGSLGFSGAPFMGYRSGLTYPTTSRRLNVGTGGSLIADYINYLPVYIQEDVTWTKTHVSQAASSAGNVRVGWYTRDTAAAFHIGTLHSDLGVIAFNTGSGLRSLTASVTLTKGWWFFAWTCDAALQPKYESHETNAYTSENMAANEFGALDQTAVTLATYAAHRLLSASRAYAALPSTPTTPTVSGNDLIPLWGFEK